MFTRRSSVEEPQPVRGVFGLPVKPLFRLENIPSDFPVGYVPYSQSSVSEGELKRSAVALFTWGVDTGVLVIIWGEVQVLMLQLSILNSPGYPMANEIINIAAKHLGKDFKFVRGCIIPGECLSCIDLDLNCFKKTEKDGDSILGSLLKHTLATLPFRDQFTVLDGLKGTDMVRATVEDALLEVFKNPSSSINHLSGDVSGVSGTRSPTSPTTSTIVWSDNLYI